MSRALVLSSGGSRGSFQAPVVDRLLDEGFEFDYIFGVSVGSLNGSLVSVEHGDVTSVWKDINDRSDVFGGAVNQGVLGKAYRLIRILLGEEVSFFDNAPLLDLIEENYHSKEAKVPFSFGTVSLKTGSFETFSIYPEDFEGDRKDSLNHLKEEDIRKYITASASIPTVLPPVFGEYVDGGLKDMAPVAHAVERGVDEVIVVTTENITSPKRSLEKPENIFGIGKVSLNIALDEIIINDYKLTSKINHIVSQAKDKGVTLYKKSGEPYKEVDLSLIEPNQNLGSGFDFSDDVIESRIKAGKREVEKFLREYN